MRTVLAGTAMMISAMHLASGHDPLRIAGIPLPDGTPVEVQPRDFIASWRSRPGDPVRLRVARDVIVDGVVVIEEGTPVEGVIIEAYPGYLGWRAARLAFVVEETTSVAGETVRLRPTLIEVRHRYRHRYLLWAGPESTRLKSPMRSTKRTARASSIAT